MENKPSLAPTYNITRYRGLWSSTIQKRFKDSETMTAEEKLQKWLSESLWPGYSAKVEIEYHVPSESL